MLTTSDLRARGWTDALIRDHLGSHDGTRANPVYRSAAPIKLYSSARVEAAEQSEAWATLLQRSETRRAAASRAAETKRARILAAVDALEVCVPVLSLEALTRRAVQSYNDFQFTRAERRQDWEYGNYREATIESSAPFLERISVNYLRHELTRYDNELDKTFGKVGVLEAYTQINRKVYDAIAAAYPTLAEECEAQMRLKESRA